MKFDICLFFSSNSKLSTPSAAASSSNSAAVNSALALAAAAAAAGFQSMPMGSDKMAPDGYAQLLQVFIQIFFYKKLFILVRKNYP